MAGQRKNAAAKAPKKPVGRPSKYTPEAIEIIKNSLELGMYHEQAAIRAGITIETFHTWQHEKPEFSEAIQKAETDCEAFHLQRIKDGPANWQSSGWFLERKYRERWYQAKEVQVKGLADLFTESYQTWHDSAPKTAEQQRPSAKN